MGDQLLAHAGFPLDQDGPVAAGDLLYRLEQLQHRAALAEHLPVAHLAEGIPQVMHLGSVVEVEYAALLVPWIVLHVAVDPDLASVIG